MLTNKLYENHSQGKIQKQGLIFANQPCLVI